MTPPNTSSQSFVFEINDRTRMGRGLQIAEAALAFNMIDQLVSEREEAVFRPSKTGDSDGRITRMLRPTDAHHNLIWGMNLHGTSSGAKGSSTSIELVVKLPGSLNTSIRFEKNSDNNSWLGLGRTQAPATAHRLTEMPPICKRLVQALELKVNEPTEFTEARVRENINMMLTAVERGFPDLEDDQD